MRPVLQHMLDAISHAPAWIRNDRHDLLAANPLALALYAGSAVEHVTHVRMRVGRRGLAEVAGEAGTNDP
ncbi:hypothetical protein ACGFIV_05445 [Sphaerisporangium sp. NPDC049003]|uniref:MmyB family transcriptional regulator n=1 Tax=Sphaerisporangium sp. NPDC049003 TaxID=3364517 RepID=UPI00371F9F74